MVFICILIWVQISDESVISSLMIVFRLIQHKEVLHHQRTFCTLCPCALVEFIIDSNPKCDSEIRLKSRAWDVEQYFGGIFCVTAEL
jgi:hypothetical protein